MNDEGEMVAGSGRGARSAGGSAGDPPRRGHFADGQLLALQMRQLGIQVKLASIPVAPTLPAFYEALGEMANGFMAPAHWEIGVTFSPEATPEGME